MRLLLALLLLATFCPAQTSRVQILAKAIAKAEGYGIKGALPNRYNNPGDLKAVRGWVYPGQVGIGKGGHVRFRNAHAGWAALEHQLDKIVQGTSKRYTVNMTLKEIARTYAGSYRVWSKNVAHNLGVDPSTYLWEILDVPPELSKL